MPRTHNNRLRALLQEADWSGAQLASALRTLAAEHGQRLACDRSTVSRWLAGTAPRPPAPELLLQALSRRLQRPVSAAEAGLSSAPATVPDLSWEADPLHRLTVLTRAETDPHIRHTLRTGTYNLAVPDVWRSGQTPSAGTRQRAPRTKGRAGHAEAEEMRTMARVFAEAAQLHGPGHVRSALAAYLSRDVTRCLHAPATEKARRRLLVGSAQLALMFGGMCADGGAEALAQHYQHTAAQLASEAGDASTFAIALRAMSTHAHDMGHHTPAVLHLAERAADAARAADGAVGAYAQAQLAVMQAHHNGRAALKALTAAERLHEQVPSAAPGPFDHYPAAALHYQRAQTLATLGDTAGANRALTTSLRLRAPTDRQGATLTRARLAESCLAQGRLDTALAHWHRFLDAYPVLHSSRVARRLGAMRRLLHPHRRHHATAQLLARAVALG
ncbi:helix-turn-helix transcriptional regulator [Streptomyces sp. NPDC007083]|uniref:helix-turn-helix transcriptional regulator n=1 Tax=Streptomyces sp. NPDC007083 TaxID=3156913 RepID=UPI0033E573B8